jgi:Asp-tRNA(Asn)/Glu-tRNA(Gln) amidotransferase A subunit family amidase
MTAHPAVSVPAGFTAGGLPVGLQLVGRYGTDDRLLSIAEAVARVLLPELVRVAPAAGATSLPRVIS